MYGWENKPFNCLHLLVDCHIIQYCSLMCFRRKIAWIVKSFVLTVNLRCGPRMSRCQRQRKVWQGCNVKWKVEISFAILLLSLSLLYRSGNTPKSHSIDYPSQGPGNGSCILTNVLFALQLNCDCYVQSMEKGHGITPASAVMEKSMGIHFNHCGCGRMSTTPRDWQWPVITAV